MFCGQSPEAIWDLTPGVVFTVIEASRKRMAHQAWLIGQYAAFGFHDPQNMPPDPSLPPPSPASGVNAEIIDIRRRVKIAHDTEKAKQNGY